MKLSPDPTDCDVPHVTRHDPDTNVTVHLLGLFGSIWRIVLVEIPVEDGRAQKYLGDCEYKCYEAHGSRCTTVEYKCSHV
jgi:hypothetical protein